MPRPEAFISQIVVNGQIVVAVRPVFGEGRDFPAGPATSEGRIADEEAFRAAHIKAHAWAVQNGFVAC